MVRTNRDDYQSCPGQCGTWNHWTQNVCQVCGFGPDDIPPGSPGSKFPTVEEEIKPHLDAAVAVIRQRCILPEYRDDMPVEELLGIAVSKFMGWDGESILTTMRFALEDSNYDRLLDGDVVAMIEKLNTRHREALEQSASYFGSKPAQTPE